MLNKSERAIINRESTDTGDIGLKTKNEDKRNKKHNTGKLIEKQHKPHQTLGELIQDLLPGL